MDSLSCRRYVWIRTVCLEKQCQALCDLGLRPHHEWNVVVNMVTQHTWDWDHTFSSEPRLWSQFSALPYIHTTICWWCTHSPDNVDWHVPHVSLTHRKGFPFLFIVICTLCLPSHTFLHFVASGVARTSPLLGHSMGTLHLYELPREVQKLIGGCRGILLPKIYEFYSLPCQFCGHIR